MTDGVEKWWFFISSPCLHRGFQTNSGISYYFLLPVGHLQTRCLVPIALLQLRHLLHQEDLAASQEELGAGKSQKLSTWTVYSIVSYWDWIKWKPLETYCLIGKCYLSYFGAQHNDLQLNEWKTSGISICKAGKQPKSRTTWGTRLLAMREAQLMQRPANYQREQHLYKVLWKPNKLINPTVVATAITKTSCNTLYVLLPGMFEKWDTKKHHR